MRYLLHGSALVLLCAAVPAIAQSLDPQQLAHCDDEVAEHRSYAVDVRISGCTALLESGRLIPENVVIIRNSRGMAYLDLGDLGRAIADFDEAIRLNPQFVLAFYNRGNVYFAQRGYARAIDDYSEAIRLNPQFAAAYHNRAVAYERLGNAARAAADRTEAARLSSR